MLGGQEWACPVQARLNFVQDEQTAVLSAQSLSLLQVLRIGNPDSAFALNRF